MNGSKTLLPEPVRAPATAGASVRHRRRALPAAVLISMLAVMPTAVAGTISLSSTGTSSMPFTMSGTVFDTTTGRTGTMQSTGVFVREYLQSTSGEDSYRITTSSTFLSNIAPPLANSVVTGIIDKIIRDFAPKPPKPPVPPVPPPPQTPRETVAGLTDDDFQGDFTATAPQVLTMSGTVTATPTLYDFGFSLVLLQEQPEFTDTVEVGLEADGLLDQVVQGLPGAPFGPGDPGKFSGSTAPTLNATEAVSLTLTPKDGLPLQLSLDVNLYWSLDYGLLPTTQQRFDVSSVVTNTSTTWSSVGTTGITNVPEIDPASAASTVGTLLSCLALVESRRLRRFRRPRRESLLGRLPGAEVAPQPGLGEAQPAFGRLP